MSTNNYFYARLKTHNPKQGYGLLRYHFAGHLFQGGARPVWYKVSPEFAAICKDALQESGRNAFDVVTETEKLEIDREEEQRRLVSMGLMSATAPAPRSAITQDIRDMQVPSRAPGRADAIPSDSGSPTPGVVTSRELGIGAK